MTSLSTALASTAWQTELVATGEARVRFGKHDTVVLRFDASGPVLEAYLDTYSCDFLVLLLFSRRPLRPGQINGFTAGAEIRGGDVFMQLPDGFTRGDFEGAVLSVGTRLSVSAG